MSAPDTAQVSFVLLIQFPSVLLPETDDFNISATFQCLVKFGPAQHGCDDYSLTAFGAMCEGDHVTGPFASFVAEV